MDEMTLQDALLEPITFLYATERRFLKISLDKIENKWMRWKISNFGEFIGYEKKDGSRYIKDLSTKWKEMKEIKRLKEYNLAKERKRFFLGRK